MRTLEKTYIDICTNFKYFLQIERVKNKGRKLCNTKLYKEYLKLKYFIYCKFKLIKKVKIMEKTIEVFYAKKYENIIEKKIVALIKNRNVELSDELNLMLGESDNLIIKEYRKRVNNKNIYRNELERTLTYIFAQKEVNMQETKIYMLIKEYSTINKNEIISLVKKSKCATIVTYNIKSFHRLEDEIFNNYDIPIIITNNKRKSLLQAYYIINFDFNEQEINEYNMAREGILFNISNNKIKQIKGFSGFIINDILIKTIGIGNKYDFIYNRFKNIRYLFAKEVEIENLCGNNGNIDLREIKKVK